jgi:hypothetical protein
LSRAVILDDRLLIEELLVGLRGRRLELHTTAYWYYRASCAAVLGAGGQLSGPFSRLGRPEQELAIRSLLDLRGDIALPDPRVIVPAMVDVASRHPRLNLMNLEAAAAGRILGGTLWLSAETAAGILSDVLTQEGIPWRTLTIS